MGRQNRKISTDIWRPSASHLTTSQGHSYFGLSCFVRSTRLCNKCKNNLKDRNIPSRLFWHFNPLMNIVKESLHAVVAAQVFDWTEANIWDWLVKFENKLSAEKGLSVHLTIASALDLNRMKNRNVRPLTSHHGVMKSPISYEFHCSSDLVP